MACASSSSSHVGDMTSEQEHQLWTDIPLLGNAGNEHVLRQGYRKTNTFA